MRYFQIKCFQEDTITLKGAVRIAKGLKRATEDFAKLKNPQESRTVFYTSERKPPAHARPTYEYSKQYSNTTNNTGQRCGNCGYAQHFKKEQCPAKTSTCSKCQKLGHYAQACRSSALRTSTTPQRPTNSWQQKPNSWQQQKPNQWQQKLPAPSREIKHLTTGSGQRETKRELNDEEYAELARYQRAKTSFFDNVFHAIDETNSTARRIEVNIGFSKTTHLVDTGTPINVIGESSYHSLDCPKLTV